MTSMNGKGSYLDQVRVGMSYYERTVFTAVAVALGHSKESLERDGDTVVMLRKIAAEVGKTLKKEVVEQVGEELFDAAHEHCDDVCTGGGAPWYDQVAARLVDPFGPLAALAMAQQMNADEADVLAVDVDRDTEGWLALLNQHAESVRRGDDEERRRRLVDTGVVVAEWIAALDRPQPVNKRSEDGDD
jgi:hypothetical protein